MKFLPALLALSQKYHARATGTSRTEPVLGASWKVASRLILLDPDVDRWLRTGLGMDPEV